MIAQELKALLSLRVPMREQKNDTFFDIVGMQYRETAISQAYAYFLNPEKSGSVAEMFLSALVELVYRKTTKKFTLTDYVCSTEVQTNKGNRIDILVKREDKEAIIIENKIFHTLDNDLLDYWDSTAAEKKIGIVLTLYPYQMGSNLSGKFINITHLEWIEKIESIGLPEKLRSNEEVYLKDFFSNIKNITDSNTMNKQVKFFFENTALIKSAMDTYDSAIKYVLGQLEEVARNIKCELHGNNAIWRHMYRTSGYNDIHYAFVFDTLFTGAHEITVLIELSGKALAKENSFRSDMSQDDNYMKLTRSELRGSGWCHFVHKTYKLNITDIENLSEFIMRKIQSEFEPVMSKMLTKEVIES